MAGPSHLPGTSTSAIDLTRSPSPAPLPAYVPRELTPDPTYSDPVEYSYTTGPRPAYKFY